MRHALVFGFFVLTTGWAVSNSFDPDVTGWGFVFHATCAVLNAACAANRLVMLIHDTARPRADA